MFTKRRKKASSKNVQIWDQPLDALKLCPMDACVS